MVQWLRFLRGCGFDLWLRNWGFTCFKNEERENSKEAGGELSIPILSKGIAYAILSVS